MVDDQGYRRGYGRVRATRRAPVQKRSGDQINLELELPTNLSILQRLPSKPTKRNQGLQAKISDRKGKNH